MEQMHINTRKKFLFLFEELHLASHLIAIMANTDKKMLGYAKSILGMTKSIPDIQ